MSTTTKMRWSLPGSAHSLLESSPGVRIGGECGMRWQITCQLTASNPLHRALCHSTYPTDVYASETEKETRLRLT
jgi:hypothetical protein